MRRILILIILLIYAPNPGKPGSYNWNSNLAYCTDRISCLHEIGHALDDHAGMISNSSEFHLGMSVYLKISDFDELYTLTTMMMLSTKQQPDQEIYAWMFAWADGDIDRIPYDLQKYYDRETAEKYLKQVDNRVLVFWDFARFTNPIMKR